MIGIRIINKIKLERRGNNIMKEMFNIKHIGCLTLDKVLFESYYPILFTCKDEKRNLFLCVCCQLDSGVQKWLISKTKVQNVIKMLKDEITIRDAFVKTDDNNKYSIIFKDCEYVIKINDVNDWNSKTSIYLPTEGEFMESEDGEFDEEIEYFRR